MIDVLLIIFSALLISVGFFFLSHIDREFKSETHANLIFFGGIVLIAFGAYVLVQVFSWPVLKRKIIGLIVAAGGYWLAFRYPDVTEYQPEGIGWTGVLAGVAIMIIGGYFLLV